MKNNFDLRKFLTENKNSIKEENINELTGDQEEAVIELKGILDDAARLGDEAREIIREKFPRMLSKGDAYGAFEFGSSANTYDTTLSSIIEEIEEYYDEEEYDEEDLDEEVVNEDILTVYAFYKFLLLIGLGATINQAYKKAKEGLFGERAKKMANKFSGVIDKFVDKITEEDIDTSEEVKKK